MEVDGRHLVNASERFLLCADMPAVATSTVGLVSCYQLHWHS